MAKDDASEPRWGLAARLIVTLAAAGALIPAVVNAAHAAHAGAYLAARYRGDHGPEHKVIAAMEQLGDEMGRRVPAGSRVYLDEPDEIWWFRLLELATMHTLTPMHERAGAEFVLHRRVDPAATAGVALEVTSVAG
jgi:hypothetical protein